jgi:hypothetical protein
MLTDNHGNTRPDRNFPDWDPTATAPKPDRATYEAARRAELDHIRRLDVTYGQLLNISAPRESVGMMIFGIATIFRGTIRRSATRRSMSCISAAESWFAWSKSTYWGA